MILPTDYLEIRSTDPQFFEMLNVSSQDDRDEYTRKTDVVSGDLVYGHINNWVFPNVWDRRPLYFHASFVTNAVFHYLGRAGDFYPIVSKIYQAQFLPESFEIHLTRDGVNELELPFEDYSVELSFLVDSGNYQE
jgi:hypothetical protein